MTLAEQIQKQLTALPPEKQSEVLDFIAFLQQRVGFSRPAERRSLKKHAAFGSWKNRKIDAVEYQQNLCAEWEMTALSVNALNRAQRLANESAKLEMKEEQAMADGNFD